MRTARQIVQRYAIVLAALLILPLTFGPALAQGTHADSSNSAVWVGQMIATVLITIVAQRAVVLARKSDQNAKDAKNSVQQLNKDLGVADPLTPTPDLTKMQEQITQLDTDLKTLQKEHLRTLEERDAAREQVAQQVAQRAEDNLAAQTRIDKLTNDLRAEQEASARLEKQLSEYEQRFRQQELDIAHIKGRLDQQGIQDQVSNAMQTAAKLLNDTAATLAKLVSATEATPT